MSISQAATTSLSSTRDAARLTRADFDMLVDQFQQPLQRFLYGLVHDPELAADLCQETFLSAYRAAPRLHGELNISAWLYTIALNHARGYLRRKRLLSWVPFVASRDDRAASGTDMATRAAERDALQALLKQLPVEQRACLLLHAEGFRYAEIGHILNCSVGAVKLRIFRARERCMAITRKKEDA